MSTISNAITIQGDLEASLHDAHTFSQDVETTLESWGGDGDLVYVAQTIKQHIARAQKEAKHLAKLLDDHQRADPEYRVDEDGAIVDRHGCPLYTADSIEGLVPVAKRRLAELHSAAPELAWEGDGEHKGAWNILIEEGLMHDSRSSWSS